MKKILIIGFPHCGTTILRCILGKCTNVKEQFYEEFTFAKAVNIRIKAEPIFSISDELRILSNR